MKTGMMTTAAAKGLMAAYLAEWNVQYRRLTARTVSFADLARGDCVFVTIHGWQPDPIAASVKHYAAAHGFCVQFD